MIKTVGICFLFLLKLLGCILAVLLLLLLAGLVLILLVPVRYRVDVRNSRGETAGQADWIKNFHMQFQFSWLLHLIHVRIVYDQKKFQNSIRIAGIDFHKAIEWFRSHRKKGRHAPDEPVVPNESVMSDKSMIDESMINESMIPDGQKSAAKEHIEPDGRVKPSNGTTQDKGASSLKPPTETLADNVKTGYKTVGQPSSEPMQTGEKTRTPSGKQKQIEKKQIKTKQIETEKRASSGKQKQIKTKQTKKTASDGKSPKKGPSKKNTSASKEKTPRTNQQKKAGSGRVARFKKEFTDQANRNTAVHLWKEACYLFCHYKPKKLKADISFSLANPALTGEVLGGLSMFPLLYRYPCNIAPDFTSDAVYVEGFLWMQGKVGFGVFAVSLLRLIRDKDAMQCMRRLMGRGS